MTTNQQIEITAEIIPSIGESFFRGVVVTVAAITPKALMVVNAELKGGQRELSKIWVPISLCEVVDSEGIQVVIVPQWFHDKVFTQFLSVSEIYTPTQYNADFFLCTKCAD